MKEITYDEFVKNVVDLSIKTANDEDGWATKTGKPVVLKFYASWCGPCRMLAPIMDEIATKYEDKVDFYAIDIDRDRAMSEFFAVKSVPTVVYIPNKGKPQVQVGVHMKGTIEKNIQQLYTV